VSLAGCGDLRALPGRARNLPLESSEAVTRSSTPTQGAFAPVPCGTVSVALAPFVVVFFPVDEYAVGAPTKATSAHKKTHLHVRRTESAADGLLITVRLARV
jgi:hypothetical protein